MEVTKEIIPVLLGGLHELVMTPCRAHVNKGANCLGWFEYGGVGGDSGHGTVLKLGKSWENCSSGLTSPEVILRDCVDPSASTEEALRKYSLIQVPV